MGAMSALGVMVALNGVATQALGCHGRYVSFGHHGRSERCSHQGIMLPQALCPPWALLSL